LADLIIGKQDFQTASAREESWYARRAGEKRSWLIRTPMGSLGADPVKWIDRSLPKLERERVASIEIKGTDGGLVRLSRVDPANEEFAVSGLPQGAKVRKSAVTEATGAINLFSIDDVAKLDPAKFAGGTQAVYRSFDGVVLTVRQVREGDNRRLAFSAGWDADTAKAFADSKAPKLLPLVEAEGQVKDWNARYADWSFVVPESMGDVFARTAVDFVEKPPQPGSPPMPEGEEAPPVPTDGG